MGRAATGEGTCDSARQPPLTLGLAGGCRSGPSLDDRAAAPQRDGSGVAARAP